MGDYPCAATWEAIGGRHERCKSPVPGYTAAEVAEAREMLACPWYAKTGDQTCKSGCYDEPRCETCVPPGGWEAMAGYGTTEADR